MKERLKALSRTVLGHPVAAGWILLQVWAARQYLRGDGLSPLGTALRREVSHTIMDVLQAPGTQVVERLTLLLGPFISAHGLEVQPRGSHHTPFLLAQWACAAVLAFIFWNWGIRLVWRGVVARLRAGEQDAWE